LPVSIKLGDANLDGFPDFLIITGFGKDHVPSLVYSVPCAVGVVGCGNDGSGERGWEVATQGVESLQAVKDARSLSFLDMDEDVSFDFLLILVSNSFFYDGQGTLDILVQRTGSAGHGNFLFIQNNFYYDAFFLKAIGMYCCFIQKAVQLKLIDSLEWRVR
jgi:integrin alpha FG-GAP repeat containing protein 1